MSFNSFRGALHSFSFSARTCLPMADGGDGDDDKCPGESGYESWMRGFDMEGGDRSYGSLLATGRNVERNRAEIACTYRDPRTGKTTKIEPEVAASYYVFYSDAASKVNWDNVLDFIPCSESALRATLERRYGIPASSPGLEPILRHMSGVNRFVYDVVYRDKNERFEDAHD